MSGTPTPRDGRDSNVLSVGDVELGLSPSGDDPPGRTNQQRALSHVRSGVRSPSSSSGRFTPPRRASGFRELSQGLSSPTSSVYRGNDLAGIFARAETRRWSLNSRSELLFPIEKSARSF